MTTEPEIKKHISYSELTDWYKCPYYHDLKWIKKSLEPFGNEYTITGTAVHSTCELFVCEEYEKRKNGEEYIFDEQRIIDYYISCFKNEMKSFMENNEPAYKKLNRKNTMVVFEQCKGLFKNILEELKNKFGNYEVIKSEHKIYQPLEKFDYNFKGFIDLILKTESGKYIIIDWKTGSYWDAKKRSSKQTTYQLTYYKHFFVKEFNIDPNDIETYFILLKRTVKKNNVEFIPVTVGSKKISNAIEYLNEAVENILLNKITKSRYHCTECECYKKQCMGV